DAPDVIARQRDVAEILQRAEASRRRVLAALASLLLLARQVSADLVVEFVVAWSHALLLRRPSGVHDPSDCVHELRPPSALAHELRFAFGRQLREARTRVGF